MKIINHRISRLAENKVIKLKELSKKGIENYEIDLQLCKDDIVVYHNFTLENLGIFKNIEDYKYKDLESLGIDNLDKLFLILKSLPKLDIYLDLKGYNEKLIYLLLPKLEKIKNHNIFIQSFNYNFIKLITIFKNTHNKSWKIGFITAGYISSLKYNIDYLVSEKCYYNLYKNIDIPLYLYTVNSPDELKKDFKLEGIFTDYPENF